MLKSTFSGLQCYNAVADNNGSIFIRLAVVAYQICEIQRDSPKIRSYSSSTSSKVRVLEGSEMQSWCQSKAHIKLSISD